MQEPISGKIRPMRSDRPMKLIAAFEALKGLAVLLAGLALLHYLHQDIGAALTHLLTLLHVDPLDRLPRTALGLAERATPRTVAMIFAGCAVYAAMRFTEAWGLWHAWRWARWLGALGGAVYIPFELYELIARPSLVRLATVTANSLIVAYLGWSLRGPERPPG